MYNGGMNRAVYLILIMLLCVGCAQKRDPAWDRAVAAFDSGDYDAAIREMRPLAERGDAHAQNNMGLMHFFGQGVPQDYDEAARWFRLAAEQGNTEAQYSLGASYLFGNGVPQDSVYGYMWADIAVSNGAAVPEIMSAFASEMTAEQVEKAKALARECIRKEYKGC